MHDLVTLSLSQTQQKMDVVPLEISQPSSCISHRKAPRNQKM